MTHPTLDHGPRLSSSCRATALAAAGILLCATPATMAQEFPPSDATDAAAMRLSLAQSGASLAALQADASRQMFRQSQVRYQAGLASFPSFLQAQSALVEADVRLKYAELNVEEIEAGGGPVRTEISAPLVDGRDFVSERLQIEFDSFAVRSTNLEQIIEIAEAEIDAGVATPESIGPLTVDRARLAAEAERIRESLDLRQSFLDGVIDARTAELEFLLRSALARRQAAEAAVAHLREANSLLQVRFEAGTVGSDEVSALTTELLQAESAMLTARTEIDMIEQELARQD